MSVIRSMTGFASGQGSGHGYAWSWELRAVNGRGLDLRLRIPDFVEGLERSARAALQEALARGNVTLGLRIQSEDGASSIAAPPQERIDAALVAMQVVEERAKVLGLALSPVTAADVLGVRGVMDGGTQDRDIKPLVKTLTSELSNLIKSFNAARADEGKALESILREQLDGVERLVADARDLLPDRQAAQETALRAALDRVGSVAEGVEEQRIAQELAMVAVKSDVTEEIDRLGAHIAAGRALLDKGGPIGRKFDFLCQEFNREANTLCSKSTHPPLTAVGLDLKAAIDQMREQVQNLE